MSVLVALGVGLVPAPATAAESFNGSISATSPEQIGRLFRDGTPSTCSAPKTASIFDAVTPRHFASHSVTNTSANPRCLTVSSATTASPCENVFVVAYLNSFNPNVVTENYLADQGSSIGETFPPPAPFSFVLPAGATAVLVVSEVNPDTTCAGYSLTVEGLNEAPVATADRYRTKRGEALEVAAPGVLGNDTDPDGDALTAALSSPPANGTVALQPDGSFTYTPNAGFVGTDTFEYEASDGSDVSAATVRIEVRPPTLKVRDAQVEEGDGGTSLLRFPVVLTPRCDDCTVTVEWQTADGSATSPGDFTASSGTLTFAPGERRHVVKVPVAGDTVAEPNEGMHLVLTAAVNAVITRSTATGIILDDD